MLRRLRGILGTALTWGAAWSLVSLVVGGVRWFLLGSGGLGSDFPLLGEMVVFGAMGATAGTFFAILLTRAERRLGTFDALSIRRTAAWGALGGAVPLACALLVSTRVVVGGFGMTFALGLGGVLGAVSAAGSLALARRAPREPAQLGSPMPDIMMPRRGAVEAPTARS